MRNVRKYTLLPHRIGVGAINSINRNNWARGGDDRGQWVNQCWEAFPGARNGRARRAANWAIPIDPYAAAVAAAEGAFHCRREAGTRARPAVFLPLRHARQTVLRFDYQIDLLLLHCYCVLQHNTHVIFNFSLWYTHQIFHFRCVNQFAHWISKNNTWQCIENQLYE